MIKYSNLEKLIHLLLSIIRGIIVIGCDVNEGVIN